MFREMRRNTKELSKEEAEAMLREAAYGTLAMQSVDGHPYSVPTSFVYDGGKLYFHGARAGQKYETFVKNDEISFSVVGKNDIQPAKFTTFFASAIAFGKAKMLTDDKEIQKGMELFLKKYSPEFMESGKEYIKEKWDAFYVYEVTIEQLTGKGC